MPPARRRQPPPPPSQRQQPPLHADSAGTGSGVDASTTTTRARHPAAAAAAAAVPSVVAAAAPSSSSSRIIVRNLPKHITIQRFRDHFAARGGTVTDASLAHAPDGTFRRFGFIGFRSAKEARAAVKFFDQTFLDTSRLQVDFARSLHDQATAAAAAGPGGDATARPWSRYSEGSSAHRRDEEKAKAEELRRKEREERAAQHRAEVALDRERKQSLLQSLYADRSDPKLKEFLEVMRPRAAARARTWANDDALGSSSAPTPASTAAPAAKKLEVLAVPNKKPGGQGLLVTRAHVKFAGDDDDEDDDLYEDLASTPAPTAPPPDEPHTDAVNPAPEKAAVLDSAVSDLDYMKSRMRAELDDDDGDGDIDHDRGQEAHPDDIDDDDEDEDHAADAGNGDAAGSDHQTLPNPPIGPGAGSDTAPTATVAVTSAHPDAWTPAKLIEAVPERARLKAAEEGAAAGPSAAHDVPSADTIADTGRLFVRNLPYSCEVADLEKLFGQFGQLTE
ncbi:hypothetical protein HK405_013887, partial [Cladochytrium tenue]